MSQHSAVKEGRLCPRLSYVLLILFFADMPNRAKCAMKGTYRFDHLSGAIAILLRSRYNGNKKPGIRRLMQWKLGNGS